MRFQKNFKLYDLKNQKIKWFKFRNFDNVLSKAFKFFDTFISFFRRSFNNLKTLINISYTNIRVKENPKIDKTILLILKK